MKNLIKKYNKKLINFSLCSLQKDYIGFYCLEIYKNHFNTFQERSLYLYNKAGLCKEVISRNRSFKNIKHIIYHNPSLKHRHGVANYSRLLLNFSPNRVMYFDNGKSKKPK